MATMPPSSCVAREWTDFGKAVGRYDGEGAIATCRGMAATCPPDARSRRQGVKARKAPGQAAERLPPLRDGAKKTGGPDRSRTCDLVLIRDAL